MTIECPKCQTNNPDTVKFCGDCGTPLPHDMEITESFTKTLETPVTDFAQGTIFADRYEIVKELGRGGMGVVYKAHDTKLKRTVALKFLPPELTHISEIKERFMHEAQAAAALDHPHICTVYEFDEAEKKTFISMAYIEGQSLKKKIKSESLELDEALRIATQVAEGLQEAHKKGVVHRDIKSANIMMDKRDQAKIMDFGLARMTGQTLLTKEGMAMGTIAYMSPEQAQGKEVDQRTDIWSLGVVLYEIFSGQLPFKGDHEQTVLYSILNEKPKPITDLRSEIPVSIGQVVSKALEKKPDERYQQVEELLDDLKSISAGIVPEEIKTRLRKAKLRRRKRAILYTGSAGLIIIMAVIALSLFTGRAEAMDSIAVLLFENLSGDPDQEYFSDGITDALINELAKISALRVISRQSMMRYKGSEKPLPEIARELNVDAVVEASVLTVGGRVQIRAQLIQAATEQNLWAQSYERDLSNILILQSEMARAIAGEIKVMLTPEEETLLASPRPVNPETYKAYLRGMYHMNRDEFERGLEYLKQAVDEDPADPIAYAGLALGYATIGHSQAQTPESFPRARAAALQALELDETLAVAHLALGDVKLYWDWDWPGAKQALQRALELNPNLAIAHYHYGWYLDLMGREDEAQTELKRAQELDPLTPLFTAWVGFYYEMRLGQYEEAIEEVRKSLDLLPDYSVGLGCLGDVYRHKGMYEEAIATHKKLEAVTGKRSHLALTYAMAGQRNKAQEIVEIESKAVPRVFSARRLARIYAAMGEKDEAFRWLEVSYSERESLFPWLKMVPEFGPLWEDPRFQDLLQRMNLSVKE